MKVNRHEPVCSPIRLACRLAALLTVLTSVQAKDPVRADTPSMDFYSPSYDISVPAPTLTSVPYGGHGRNVLDLWKASSDHPTPVVLVVHGGGWREGSKERLHKFVDTQALLDKGISVVAINYRLLQHAGGVEPPVRAPLEDAARALQFVRSKAAEWNIDKDRIGAAGGSAGACSCLWLAYHADLADPASEDPVARESTRLMCAAVKNAQTTLDPQQMRDWIPNIRYGAQAFGKKNFEQFLADRERILPWISEYSPYALVSEDDPPVYLFYANRPDVGNAQNDAAHSANFGVKLQERCREIGVLCDTVYRGASGVEFQTPTDYLIAVLLAQGMRDD